MNIHTQKKGKKKSKIATKNAKLQTVALIPRVVHNKKPIQQEKFEKYLECAILLNNVLMLELT